MDPKPPSSFIEAAHAAALDSLPMDDAADVEDAERGFLVARKPAAVTNERGDVVWDNDAYAFLDGDAPTTRVQRWAVEPDICTVPRWLADPWALSVPASARQRRPGRSA
jgi:alkyl sulfatase BDS1-like metallo-beta-lactamase superfamily hydrolase